MNIIDKVTMYRLLRSGQLGNTNRSWASLDHYLRDQEKEKKTVGIRSTKPGGLCLYHVPYNDVWGKIVKHWPNGGYNISEMMNDEDIKYQGEYCGLGRVLTISRVKKPMREALLEYQYNYQGYKAETILGSEDVLAMYHLFAWNAADPHWPSHRYFAAAEDIEELKRHFDGQGKAFGEILHCCPDDVLHYCCRFQDGKWE